MRRRREADGAARTRVPVRKSLLTRLLAVSVLVSVMSIAATAWLAAQTTSGAIRQEQGQVLADDARIYDKLLGLAATRPNWREADRTVRRLAADTGRRIALTTENRKVIADSAGPGGERGARLPARASAVVDPLAVDSTLAAGRKDGLSDTGAGATVGPDPAPVPGEAPTKESRAPEADGGFGGVGGDPGGSGGDPGGTGLGTGAGLGTGTGAVDRIDPRAVGPFRLPESERRTLRAIAERNVACLRDRGVDAKLVVGPSGRPHVQVPEDADSRVTDYSCGSGDLINITATERKALDKVNKLAWACMRRKGSEPVKFGLTIGRGGTPRLYLASIPQVAPEPTPSTPGGTPPPSRDAPAQTPRQEADAARKAKAARSEAEQAEEALAASCIDSARREQLGPYVSSPALLFITSPDGSRPSDSGFQLSGANTTRLVGLAAAILAVTVAATAFAATRLTRPLRALTTATQRMKTGEATEPVPARSAGEISQLAAAFNDMAAHRKALEEQRKAMVSDVAHELRTPLSNIRGWLEAAEDGVVATDPELVTSLLEEALLLQHIVNDLQDLAAADAGTLRLHREPVRAVELADQVVAAHQARADAAGVRLTARATGDPWLTADPLRLRQAIGNLVSNAIRHTPAGGEVTVSCRNAGVGADAGVLIEVSDTGTGIAPGDLPHVFDRFWRADKSRTRATGGSGLGLAIVRNLVQAHGGTVGVESERGKGSVFTVRLPVT
ncbi:sensor histidine kinase [Streptomyces flavofungini]|uniref:sensor histidine kinase n=1 Tax=Streptomyces flavofungini TaxID=68200 RepID=UPI0025B1C093|nr:HAMP domain-containing sensor histidine kinase [Streptomyces flavofungini]WJV47095.1 HAMP domain-containing sensor histidine kinase [Streptomyces flavofungini]